MLDVNLGVLIRLLEEDGYCYSSTEDLVEAINKEFDTKVTLDDVIKYYSLDICMDELNNLKYLYGEYNNQLERV